MTALHAPLALCRLLTGLGAGLIFGLALAQSPAPAPFDASLAPMPAANASDFLAADLREEVQRLPVTVKNLFGREETKSIVLTLFRPAGDGPFPFVVVSHGRATQALRAQQTRQRFLPLSRYLVDKGFAVLVPTRVGYGDTYGEFDPEDAGGCSTMRVAPMHQAASDQVLAAVAHAKTLPYVDATRWVALGQSVGGLTTLAVVARKPEGLVAAINFAGGAGGDPVGRPNNPCLPRNLERHWASLAAQSSPLPVLWLYWVNDKYWGPEQPKRWAKAWVDGGGKAEFHQLPAVGEDGHSGMAQDMNTWVPLVEAHLAQAGFSRSGLVARPAATAFAKVDELDKVPVAGAVGDASSASSATTRENLYKRFLAAKAPRAFALGADGAAGFAMGDWALGRALGNCQARRGAPCKLYAVDDDVVWVP